MSDLTKDEKRLLTLGMGLLALQALIGGGMLRGDPDAQLEAGRTYVASKQEFDKLFNKVDQDILIEKLK